MGAWSSFLPGSAAVTNSERLTRSGRVMFPDRYLMHFPGLATDGTQVDFSQGIGDFTWGESLARVPLDGARQTPCARRSAGRLSTAFLPTGPGCWCRNSRRLLGWTRPRDPYGRCRSQGRVLCGRQTCSRTTPPGHGVTANSRLRMHKILDVAERDGSHPRKLATTGRANGVRWAPDDSALRFTVSDGTGHVALEEASTEPGCVVSCPTGAATRSPAAENGRPTDATSCSWCSRTDDRISGLGVSPRGAGVRWRRPFLCGSPQGH